MFTWRGPTVIRVTRPLLLGHWASLAAAAPVDDRSKNSAPASATVSYTVVVLSDVTLEERRAPRWLLDFWFWGRQGVNREIPVGCGEPGSSRFSWPFTVVVTALREPLTLHGCQELGRLMCFQDGPGQEQRNKSP